MYTQQTIWNNNLTKIIHSFYNSLGENHIRTSLKISHRYLDTFKAKAVLNSLCRVNLIYPTVFSFKQAALQQFVTRYFVSCWPRLANAAPLLRSSVLQFSRVNSNYASVIQTKPNIFQTSSIRRAFLLTCSIFTEICQENSPVSREVRRWCFFLVVFSPSPRKHTLLLPVQERKKPITDQSGSEEKNVMSPSDWSTFKGQVLIGLAENRHVLKGTNIEFIHKPILWRRTVQLTAY